MDYKTTTFEELRNLLRNRYSTKWTRYPADVIPMWVADMDLGVDPAISSEIEVAAFKYGLGYPSQSLMDELTEAFVDLYANKIGGRIDPKLTISTTDVVQSIYIAISTFSNEGDGVIVQTPIYPPFLSTPKLLKREVVENRLILENDQYHFDIEDFRVKANDPRNKIALLCSPHNPTGLVLSNEELDEVAQICSETNTLMIVDEIHGQLIFGATFTSIAAIETDANYVICNSATKAYNIAGSRCAMAAFSSKYVMDHFDQVPFHLRGMPSNLGVVASIAAWKKADQWLVKTVDHIGQNRKTLMSFATKTNFFQLPINSHATYLAWLSFADDPDPAKTILDRAKVALSPGHDFGEVGKFHTRMNLATTTPVLREALDRIEAAF
ncbi:MAG: aminotransferase class I/II-fold pyridoxal phosphate-dependent enzyme [Actinomycetota bacterium]|nr:aminotransferase class I/II-fold pyridoxal phosphate-dependent enzyme [Actinomycetota bacterium]